MLETSASLLERARDPADAEAWRRLVGLYEPLIRGWLRRYALQPSDADDLVQDVMGILTAELPRFQHNRRVGAFRCWLRTLAVNALRRSWRSGQFRPRPLGGSDFAAVLDRLEDPVSDLSQLWDREHDVYLVRRVLQAIERDFRPKTWQAFRRLVLEGTPAATVAQELGVSVNAVLIAKSHVLRRLREQVRGLID